MRTRPLGGTGLPCPVVGQGCMGVGGGLTAEPVDVAAQMRSLRLGVELGMTLLDTAEAYAQGASEEIVGRAIRDVREQVVIASKVSPEHAAPAELRAAAERSLRRLATDRIDLYQLHWPSAVVPLGETLGAMAELAREGKVRFVGVSNLSPAELDAAVATLPSHVLVSLQGEYNLLERSAESELLPRCRDAGLSFLAYSPLDQGRIGDDREALSRLAALARSRGVSPAQLALAWVTSREPVIAIPKALAPDHVRENAVAGTLAIDERDREAIDAWFESPVLELPTDQIRVVQDGEGDRAAYETLEQALANPLGLSPSPLELADEIRAGRFGKPVRVRPSRGRDAGYELLNGRLRYWAWVIAHDGRKPIPAIVRRPAVGPTMEELA